MIFGSSLRDRQVPGSCPSSPGEHPPPLGDRNGVRLAAWECRNGATTRWGPARFYDHPGLMNLKPSQLRDLEASFKLK